MKNLLAIVLPVLLVLWQTRADAQNIVYGGIFPTIDHSGKLSDKWAYHSYIFAAIKPYSHQDQTDKSRMLYAYGEWGLTYSLTERLSATSAYVYERQQPFEGDYRNENRFHQQLTYQLPLSEKLTLKQRLRFDARFIENRATKQTPFTHRLRYLLGISQNITPSVYWFAYSEFFFDTKNQFKFNENWSALQIGKKIKARHAVELGYLYVGWVRNSQNDWLHQHYLQLTWVSRVDFSKK